MKNKFTIPQLNYLVFQLVKIKTDDYLKGSYRAEEDEVVYFATMPTTFDYRLAARDAIAQTDSNVFLTRFDYSPERCTITGTFGDAPRLIAGSYMTGWARLKQFEESIIRKSKTVVTPPDGDTDRYFYALNYFDFAWQRFGHINIQSFGVRGNAQENTQLVRYTCDFILIGDLIDVQSYDPLLIGLKGLFGQNGIADEAIGYINDILGSAEPYLNIATLPFDTMNVAQELIAEATGFLTGYDNSNRQIYSRVESLFQ